MNKKIKLSESRVRAVIKKIIKEEFDDYGDDGDDYGDAIEQLLNIKDKMKELVEEAKHIIRNADDDRGIYERARRQWAAHIEGALDKENDWKGGSMHTMQDTIDELE